jgi:hypothetical protein
MHANADLPLRLAIHHSFSPFWSHIESRAADRGVCKNRRERKLECGNREQKCVLICALCREKSLPIMVQIMPGGFDPEKANFAGCGREIR